MAIAASASQADVQTAIDAATYEETVYVPGGSATWSSQVTVSKGITISGGYGGSDTVITCSSGEFMDYSADATTKANDHLFELTGFTVDCDDNTNVHVLFLENTSNTVAVRVKIHDNIFRNEADGTILYFSGPFLGVVYSNTFTNCPFVWRVFGNDSLTEWETFDHSDAVFGSADNLYFEDNTINYTDNREISDPGGTMIGNSGRIVCRYNLWDMANSCDNDEFWDIHGFQNWTANQTAGSMNCEYYGNILQNGNGPYRWMDHRAYKILMFNNRASGSGSYLIEVDQKVDSCYLDVGKDYSEIEGAYFWNNWANGSEVAVTINEDNCSTLVENDRYWDYASSFDGSSGIGVGSSVPTMSCTTGVGYWVTSYSPANTPPTTIADMKTYCQAGSFYRATGTDTWGLFYTPYTYPHPLRGETVSFHRNRMRIF